MKVSVNKSIIIANIVYLICCTSAFSAEEEGQTKYLTIEVTMKSGKVVYSTGSMEVSGKLNILYKQKIIDRNTNVAILAKRKVPLYYIDDIVSAIRKIGVKEVRTFIYDDTDSFVLEYEYVGSKPYTSNPVELFSAEGWRYFKLKCAP